jgi:hypothetical protein
MIQRKGDCDYLLVLDNLSVSQLVIVQLIKEGATAYTGNSIAVCLVCYPWLSENSAFLDLVTLGSDTSYEPLVSQNHGHLWR